MCNTGIFQSKLQHISTITSYRKNHNSAISFWALASQLSLTANKQRTEEGEGRSYCLALTVVVPDCKQIQNRGGEEEGGSHCLVSNVLHYYICLSVSSFGLRFVWMIIWAKFADVSWDLLCAMCPSSTLSQLLIAPIFSDATVAGELCVPWILLASEARDDTADRYLAREQWWFVVAEVDNFTKNLIHSLSLFSTVVLLLLLLLLVPHYLAAAST